MKNIFCYTVIKHIVSRNKSFEDWKQIYMGGAYVHRLFNRFDYQADSDRQ